MEKEGNGPEDFAPAGDAGLVRRRVRRSRGRGPVIMGIVIVASAALMVFLWPDVSYLFQSWSPRDLGDATKIPPESFFRPDAFVRVRGDADIGGSDCFQFRGQSKRIFDLVGSTRFYIQLDDPAGACVKERGSETLSPVDARGRLVSLSSAPPQYARVVEVIEKHEKRVQRAIRAGGHVARETRKDPGRFWEHVAATPDIYLIVDGDTPGDRWYYLLVYGVLLAFMGVNGWLLWRWRREARIQDNLLT